MLLAYSNVYVIDSWRAFFATLQSEMKSERESRVTEKRFFNPFYNEFFLKCTVISDEIEQRLFIVCWEEGRRCHRLVQKKEQS